MREGFEESASRRRSQKSYRLCDCERVVINYAITTTIVVSRSELVKYLNSLGLVIGNKVKQKFDIPAWIKKGGNYLKMVIQDT